MVGAEAAVGAALGDAAAILALAAGLDLPLLGVNSEQPDACDIRHPANAAAATIGSHREVSGIGVECFTVASQRTQ